MSIAINIANKPEFRSEEYRRDREDRRDAFINGAVKKAERAEKEQGHASPSVVLAGAQRTDVFTEDAEFDASRAAVENRTSLPVKQYEINPDGTLVKVLGEAAQELVKQGIFCFRCEERQPDSEVEKRKMMKRAEDAGLMIRQQWTAKENCCYCGAKLGLQGDHDYHEQPTTNDQKDILDAMMNTGKGIQF